MEEIKSMPIKYHFNLGKLHMGDYKIYDSPRIKTKASFPELALTSQDL